MWGFPPAVSPVAGHLGAHQHPGRYRFDEWIPKCTIPAPAEISLTQNRVTGSTGCNQLSGPVMADTHQIQFGPLVTTKMACADSTGSVERQFLNALAQPMAYQISQGRLTLFRKGKAVLTFRKTD